MSLWRQVTRGLRRLLKPGHADRDIRDEVSHYIDATTQHLRSGLTPTAARRAALLDVRNETGAREEIRASGWEHNVELLLSDLRLALRRLGHSPAFTIVSVLTLALGVGATTAIFSAIKPILFDPLPFPQAERIVMISDQRGRGNADRCDLWHIHRARGADTFV